MHYDHIVVPESGRRIGVNPDFSLTVPDAPIIPFIEGDGIGVDVTPAMRRVKDVIADNFLQQVLLRPEEYDVIATLNLNGDYVSDALAAQVGGIGIAPGGNIGDGLAVFEATHGTAPGFAGKDRVNPGSLILSAEMMLRYLGWREAADLIIKGVTSTIAHKELTYDLARLREAIKAGKRELAARKNVEEDLQRLIPGATLMSTSGFAGAVIRHMDDPA